MTIERIGPVAVYGLSNLEAQQWRKSCDQDAAGRIVDEYADAKLIVRCVRDDAGQPIFGVSDVPKIVELPEIVVKTLVETATRLCGLGPEAESIIRGNSHTTGTDDS